MGSYQEAAEDGRGHGDPHIPAWDSSSWQALGEDNLNSGTDGVDILNEDDGGSRYDNLMYYQDGTYMYFMVFLQDDPDLTSYTYGALMNDDASDGNYDYMVCTIYSSGTQYIAWYSWDTSGFGEWSLEGFTADTDWYRSSTTNQQEHVAFAVAYSVTLTPVYGEDYFKAVTDADGPAQGSSWPRDPDSSPQIDDYTTAATAIPEFSSLLMPIASVMLIVGYNYKSRRNSSLRT